MPPLLPFAYVAFPLWLLWPILIAVASPSPPGPIAQIVFLVSALLGLAGCLRASWSSFPQYARRPWRRFAAVGLGTAAFVVIALVGHYLGQAVATQFK